MQYDVYYQLSDEGFRGWWLVIVLALTLISLCAAFKFRDTLNRRISSRYSLFGIVVGLGGITVVSSILFLQFYGDYLAVQVEVARGKTLIIEGNIEKYSPSFGGRGDASKERFTVGGISFEYDDSLAPGFHKTKFWGNDLAESDKVRIAYVVVNRRNVIVGIYRMIEK